MINLDMNINLHSADGGEERKKEKKLSYIHIEEIIHELPIKNDQHKKKKKTLNFMN